MNSFHQNLLDALSQISGTGSSWAAGHRNLVLPGLKVDGCDELSFPINKESITALINIASKAPYGKGNKTIIDENVRSTWEIDASKIQFRNKEWDKLINHITEDIKPTLGLEGKQIEAHFYKLLIYQEGDFFLPHQDSEKEVGMFGTLIIGLPTAHKGGEFVL